MNKLSKKAVEVRGLSFRYHNLQVLCKLDLDVCAEKITFLLGENGAGKSTLIKLILGLVGSYQGQITLFGESHSASSVSKYIRYVPQVLNIDRTFPISVREVLYLEGSSNLTEELINFFKVSDLLDSKIGELSGGELQKIMIIKSMSSEPKVLILDEPTNSLDAKSKSSLFDLLREINKDYKTTILIVSHGIEFIDKECDEIILLELGEAKRVNAESIMKHQLHVH